MDDYRQALEEYWGKRIAVIGVFDKFGCRTDSTGKRVTTALLQALEMNGQPIATHCHIQFADNFVPLEMRKGDRVSFEAIVMQYKRRLAVTNKDGLLVETSYGLYHPTNIKLLDREPPVYKSLLKPEEIEGLEEEIEIEDEPKDKPVADNMADSTASAIDAVTLVAVVKKAAVDVGGWDRLQQLIDMLRQ